MSNIKYCPRCGKITIHLDKYCRCVNDFSFFSKEKSRCLVVTTDINEWDWPDRFTSGVSHDAYFFTQSLYEHIWNTYVDIPENDKLDRELFETNKTKMLDYLESGGWDGIITDHRERPKSKDASVIGRGVAGALVAGPAGAVVGALSAVDKNNRNKK